MVLTVVISIMGVIVNQDRLRTFSIGIQKNLVIAQLRSLSFLSSALHFLLPYDAAGMKEIVHG